MSPLNLGGQNGSAPASPRLIVFPRWCPDASTVTWEPLGASEVARRLLAQSFNLGAFADGGIEVVASVVERCAGRGGELVFGDPREAAEILSGLED